MIVKVLLLDSFLKLSSLIHSQSSESNFVFKSIDSDFEHEVVRYIRRLRIHTAATLCSTLCLISAFHLLRVSFGLDQVLVPRVCSISLADNCSILIDINVASRLLHRLLSMHTVSVPTYSCHLRLVHHVVFSVSHSFIARMLLQFHFEFDYGIAILLGE